MIVSIIVFALFVGYLWYRYGVNSSISAGFYDLKKNEKILFALFCFGIAVPAIAVAGIKFEPTWQLLLCFLGSAGIMIVGASAAFKESKFISAMHLYGTYSGIILWLAGLALYGIYYPAAVWLMAVVVLFVLGKTGRLNIKPKKRKDPIKNSFTTWAEVAAFVMIAAGIILQ